MMDADIKLFLMQIGYNLFEELTKKELCGCFEYVGTTISTNIQKEFLTSLIVLEMLQQKQFDIRPAAAVA